MNPPGWPRKTLESGILTDIYRRRSEPILSRPGEEPKEDEELGAAEELRRAGINDVEEWRGQQIRNQTGGQEPTTNTFMRRMHFIFKCNAGSQKGFR